MSVDVSSRLAELGYSGRVVPIDRVGELRAAIEGQHGQGLLDETLYQSYLSGFDVHPPETLFGAASIIVVAVPQPQVRVTFAWAGEPVPCIIPPTYPEREMEHRIVSLLGQILGPAGYQVTGARLPKKLLAVRSGLATYGKNNITYVPGMGSFHGLVAAYSDLPAAEDGWGGLRTMDRCANCSACLRHCPTGAITTERFLLHAERCLTYHNEKAADVPFPAWIDRSWHHCLVGCLHCQWVCPENQHVRGWVRDGVTFSEGETALLLAGVSLEGLPSAMLDKMRQVSLDLYADTLPRNLGVLIHGRSRPA